jgi:hypothetical protein
LRKLKIRAIFKFKKFSKEFFFHIWADFKFQ